MEIELTAFPPFIKLKVQANGGDVTVLDALLLDMSDYSVLYQPYEAEYAGEVVQSVSRLRARIQEARAKLKPSSDYDAHLVILQRVCREFLARIKRLSDKLEYDFQLDKRNLDAGIKLMDDQIARVRHYELVGGPNLLTNSKLNVMDIQPYGNQMLFLQALSYLRGQFSVLLSGLAEQSAITLPGELGQLTPLIDSDEADGETPDNLA